MAITATLLTALYDGVDRVTYTTASISPSANKWLVVDLGLRKGTPPDDPTISGLSLSWTKEANVLDGSGTVVTRLIRAYAWTGSSPGSGTLSFALGATNTCAGWVVYELGGADGSDPFVQTVTENLSGNSTSTAPTLAAFADASNRPLIAQLHRANEGSTPEAGYTQIDANDVFGSVPTLSVSSAIHTGSADTSPTYSWTTASPRIGIASEVAVAVVGGAADQGDPLGMKGFFGG